ncbi:anaerobic ribonucleoside-triphosphate reductase, partial [Enterococcus faecalis]|uniref:anaerobic ribonucleoside-triphosphate reductase n=1 Tax=Enterococcus faecalis TaxID=1351 RepID=UPI0031CD6BDD
DVESAKSIQTATAHISQIIANLASSQYGGCSAAWIDELIAPFAERNYEKHIAVAQQWNEGEERQKAFPRKKTKKYCFDAIQSI